MALPAGFVTDLLGPEHDAGATGGRARPKRSYLVCSTPRSGSGVLCRGLAAAGAFGTPLEYFNPVHRGILSERWGCGADLHSYVRSLHARRTTGDGLFGAKLHWGQMAKVRAEFDPSLDDEGDPAIPGELIEALFPSPRFVRIVRVDLDRQAVSYWRALSSNLWSVDVASPDPPPEPPPYDFEGIDRCRTEIQTGDACWDRFLGEAVIEPLLVTYEELDSEYAATIGRVTSYIDPQQPSRPVPPTTRKLGDRYSIELKERFLTERRSRMAASNR